MIYSTRGRSLLIEAAPISSTSQKPTKPSRVERARPRSQMYTGAA
jgi:hypothetical protein